MSQKRRSVFRIIFYVIATFLLVYIVFILSVIAGAFGKLPAKSELRSIRNPIASEVYTADGKLMGKYYFQNRQDLKKEEISCTILNALIATEDVRFYEHDGIDYRSLGRVLIKTLLLGDESSGGGSTITQQLAKNLYPRKDHGSLSLHISKVKEMTTAKKIENLYSKDEILELYLNTVPFGEDTYGIKSASQRFFNKNPKDLKIEEAALLVGMLKATGYYNPVQNYDHAIMRRNVVLNQMMKYKYLDRQKGDSLKQLPVRLNYIPLTHYSGIAPYFREYIRKELEDWCRMNYKNEKDHYNLYTDGLKIYTTIDSRLQRYADEAVQEHMHYLQKMFDEQWENRNLWKNIPDNTLLSGFGNNFKNESFHYRKRKMDVFTWEGDREREYNTPDSIKHYLQFLQTGFIAIDIRNGDVKAWVGGINHKYFKYDHVMAKRQAGSTFKPIVYLTALEQGMSPCKFIANDSIVYTEYDNWTPRNSGHGYGGAYSLKGALTHSVNTVSVKLLMKCGIDNVIEYAQNAGISSSLPDVPSLALGTADISLFEMMKVYLTIANHGMTKTPGYLTKIEDSNGTLLYEYNKNIKEEPVFSPENAEIMTAMLCNVVNHGTAIPLRTKYQFTADIAGKTGTTQNQTDGWFIGYTPGLIAGVWVGGELQNIRFRNMKYGQGSASAMPIWAGFMKRTLTDDQWKFLQEEKFVFSKSTLNDLDCEDFREKSTDEFKLFKKIKEIPFFKKIFGRKNK